MCTVTVVPYTNAGCPHGGRCVRVASNRDEQHTRPVALPPSSRSIGGHRAVFPIDPRSGGTWIAVNDAGLAFVLLNINYGSARTPQVSRGTIIPQLLNCTSLTWALGRMSALDATAFAPFRLLLLDRFALAEIRSDSERTHLVQCVRLVKPLFFTSSGLGDSIVEGPRRQLFDTSFGHPDDWLAEQERFHRHHWPEAPHLSVCMNRPDARTVSHATADLTPEGAAFVYHPTPPDLPAEAIRVNLDDQQRGAA